MGAFLSLYNNWKLQSVGHLDLYERDALEAYLYPFLLSYGLRQQPWLFVLFCLVLIHIAVRQCQGRPSVRHCEVIKGLLKKSSSVLRHSSCLHSCICTNEAHAYFITTTSARIFLKDSTHMPPHIPFLVI